MKKILLLLLLIPLPVMAETMAENAKSAIIMEYATGKVVFEKNQNERLPMASMTKMMTLLLAMEAIDNGDLSWDSQVMVSKEAADMGGSQMFLEPNSMVSIKELLTGIGIASANDAAVLISEVIGGSKDNFVKMMNDKAKALGLENTHFMNPHGLDEDNHYSSAHDMAVIARELIKHQDILKITSTYEDYFNKADGTKTWLVNTNKLVRYYPGVDGLKTGYTSNALYCLTATGMKNNIRFITVLMGEPSSDIRSKETVNMLNYAFNNYKLNTLINKNSDLGLIEIERGKKDYGTLEVINDINELTTINSQNMEYHFELKLNQVSAPLKHGDVVGSIVSYDKDNLIVREDEITIKEDIPKASIKDIFIKNLQVIFGGIK